jgi:hypothetical protein
MVAAIGRQLSSTNRGLTRPGMPRSSLALPAAIRQSPHRLPEWSKTRRPPRASRAHELRRDPAVSITRFLPGPGPWFSPRRPSRPSLARERRLLTTAATRRKRRFCRRSVPRDRSNSMKHVQKRIAWTRDSVPGSHLRPRPCPNPGNPQTLRFRERKRCPEMEGAKGHGQQEVTMLVRHRHRPNGLSRRKCGFPHSGFGGALNT